MRYELYPNIIEMTRPETLRRLVKKSVKETCLVPFETNGWSSTEAGFLGINSCNDEKP